MFNKIENKIMFAAVAAPAYAQNTVSLLPKGSDWTNITRLTVPSIISGAISLTMLVVALIFFFILILGGIKWVTSEGEEKKVTAARAQITNGLIGLAIVFAAFAIMKLIDVLFGVNIFGGLTITPLAP